MRALAAAALAGLSCAAAPELWVEALRADAAPVGGALSPGTSVVLVWAESDQAAWGRIVRARTETPLDESKLLADVFETASVERIEIAVGGPYPDLNEQVLLDAFQGSRRDLMPGLSVIYVSPTPPGEKLVEVFERRGSQWRHQPWRGDPPR